MNFQLISDIHGRLDKVFYNQKADIVILVGDVSENLDIVKQVLSSFPVPVLYIPGNHEFYKKDYYDTYNELKDFCDNSNDKIIWMDNEVIELEDFRIIGTTLWSNFCNLDPIYVENSWISINDYKQIIMKNKSEKLIENLDKVHYSHTQRLLSLLDDPRYDFLRNFNDRKMKIYDLPNRETYLTDHFSPYMSYLLNKQNTYWLDKQLNEPFFGKTIVMTHHAPSFTPLILENYITSPQVSELLNKYIYRKDSLFKVGAYCNSLEELVLNKNIDTWVHGHFHEFMNYRLGSSNVICNPTGSKTTNKSGTEDFIFNCDNNEKKIGLYYQLQKYEKSCDDLLHFLDIQINNRLDINEMTNIDILKGIWREAEIMMMSLLSLPKDEIYKPHDLIYVNIFMDFENENTLSYSDTYNMLKRMRIEIENLYLFVKQWILEINN